MVGLTAGGVEVLMGGVNTSETGICGSMILVLIPGTSLAVVSVSVGVDVGMVFEAIGSQELMEMPPNCD